MCHRLERHAAAIISNMYKRQHRSLAFAQRSLATLWGLLEGCGRVVGAPRACCEDAVLILYLEAVFAFLYF